MTENKRYQLRQEELDYPIVNFYSDLVDTANNDKVICSFELDVGTSKMVDLLNEQDEYLNILCEKLELAYEQNTKLKQENKELEKENLDLKNSICFDELATDAVCQLITKKDKEIRKLKEENELKGDFRNFINEDIVQIKKENEKLKNEIKMLKTTIARNEAYIIKLTKKERGQNERRKI